MTIDPKKVLEASKKAAASGDMTGAKRLYQTYKELSSSKEAPQTPPVGDPTKARAPFAQASSQQAGGEAQSGGLPGLTSPMASERPSPSLGLGLPSPGRMPSQGAAPAPAAPLKPKGYDQKFNLFKVDENLERLPAESWKEPKFATPEELNYFRYEKQLQAQKDLTAEKQRGISDAVIASYAKPENLGGAASFREFLKASDIATQAQDRYDALIKNTDLIQSAMPARVASHNRQIGEASAEFKKWNDYSKKVSSAKDQFISKIGDDFVNLDEVKNQGEYWKQDSKGNVIPNTDAINNYANRVLEGLGVGDNSNAGQIIKSHLLGRVKTIAQQKAAEDAIAPLIKERDVAYSNATKDLASRRSQIETLSKTYSSAAVNEADEYDRSYVIPTRDKLNSAYKSVVNGLTTQVEQLNKMYESGLVPRDQYERQFRDIESRLATANADYDADFNDFIAEVNSRTADINFRWNAKFREEEDRMIKSYDDRRKQIDSELKAKFGDDPEFIKKVNAAYSNAWKRQAAKESIAAEKAAAERYENMPQGFRQMFRFAEAFEKGLGGAIKSYGNALGSSDLYDAGVSMENRHILPERLNKGFSDLFTVAWWERQGVLAGYMAPGLAATWAVSGLTGGLGGGAVATAGRFALSGFTGWATETAQIASDIKSRVLEETGSLIKANRAAQRAYDAQVGVMWAYGLEGAPFIKLPGTGRGRLSSAALGFGAEYGQELLLQEGPQQIAEKRIMEEARGNIKLGQGYLAAYDDFYDGIQDMIRVPKAIDPETGRPMLDSEGKEIEGGVSELEMLASDMIGIGVIGAIGGFRDANKIRKETAKTIKDLVANEAMAEYARSGDSQWLSHVIDKRGALFANQLIDVMHQAGKINKLQRADLSKKVNAIMQIDEDINNLNLSGDESVAYRAMGSQAMALSDDIARQQSPIVRAVREAELKEMQRAMENIAMGKGIDGVVVTLPGSRKMFLTSSEAKRAFADKAWVDRISMLGMQRDGGVSMDAYGPGMNALLSDVWKNVIEKQQAADRDVGAVSNKYGVDVEYTNKGLKVTAKSGTTSEMSEKAKSILARLGHEVIDYQKTPQDQKSPLAEEDITRNETQGTTEEPLGTMERSGEQVKPKPVTDAIQVGTTEEMGAQPVGTEGAGQEGRGGVGPGVQGTQAPQAGTKEVEAPTVEWSGRAVRPKVPSLEPTVTYGRGDIVQEVEEPEVSKVIGMRGRFTYAGNIIPGTIAMHPEEQQTVVLIEDNGTMHDIGSIQDIRNRKIGDVGLELEDTAGQFRMSERGIVNVGGVNYIAPKGIDHIIRDEEGNIVEVRLPRVTSGGRVRGGEMSFTGGRAEELAYEITLRHIRDNANDAEIEAALAEARQAVQDEGVGGVAGQAPGAEAQPTSGEVREEVAEKAAPTPTAEGPVRPEAPPAPSIQEVDAEPAKYGYHGGTLSEKSDYLRIGYRGEQPFTGYYFTSNRGAAEQRGDRLGPKDNKQARAVDFSKYNLLRPTTNGYWAIKSGLKKIERAARNNDEDAIEFNINDIASFDANLGQQLSESKSNILDWYKEWDAQKEANFEKGDYAKSATERFETFVLKKLGYEGVDVRGLKEQGGEASPDTESEGSVIFDIKPGTVVDITPGAEPAAPSPTTAPSAPAQRMTASERANSVAQNMAKAVELQNRGVKKYQVAGMAAQNQIIASDERMREVMAKFDSAVAQLENNGKLKRRCP